MSNKVIFIVLDGLGDEPIPKLKSKTPLEFGKTPNLDRMAKEGQVGLLSPTFYGTMPTSEEGHFSLFGYDPGKYNLKRGIVTASGAGIEIREGDVALRGNFATVKNGEVIDRRAGRVDMPSKVISDLDGIEIEGISFIIKSAGEHRVGIVMRGNNLSSAITDGDPHYRGSRELKRVNPTNESEEAYFTARVLNRFLEKSSQILEKHSFNRGRKLPANFILTRGASKAVDIPSFKKKSACIAGKILYKQIGKLIGMDVLEVKGANGTIKTNLKGKFKAALKASDDYEFIFVHIKATDSLAEDGNFKGKVKFLERVDKSLKILRNFPGVIIVTSDHSTCSLLKSHCKLNIPLLVWGKEKDKVDKFSEKECGKGSLSIIEQKNLLRHLGIL